MEEDRDGERSDHHDLLLAAIRLENGVPRKYYGGFAERDVDGTLKYYQGDHLGSSTLVTDARGTVIRRASYRPFGEDRSTPVATFTPKKEFNFKEKEQDGSGFYDYGARIVTDRRRTPTWRASTVV